MKLAQLHLTLWDPMDYTVHGILQAWILEWVAFPLSRGSSKPKNWPQISCIAGRFFTSWATREAEEYWTGYPIPCPVDLANPEIKPWFPVLQEFFTNSAISEIPQRKDKLQANGKYKTRQIIQKQWGIRTHTHTQRKPKQSGSGVGGEYKRVTWWAKKTKNRIYQLKTKLAKIQSGKQNQSRMPTGA